VPACEKTGSCHCLLCALSTFQNHITLPTAQERCANPYTEMQFSNKTKKFRVDDQKKVLHGLYKNPLRDPYDDHEWQQTSPRAPSKTQWKTSPCKIMLAVGTYNGLYWMAAKNTAVSFKTGNFMLLSGTVFEITILAFCKKLTFSLKSKNVLLLPSCEVLKRP